MFNRIPPPGFELEMEQTYELLVERLPFDQMSCDQTSRRRRNGRWLPHDVSTFQNFDAIVDEKITMLVFDVKSFLSFQPLFKFKKLLRKSFSIKLDLSLLFPEWIPFYCIKQFGYSDSTTTENMSTGWSWLDDLTRTKLRFEPISVTHVIPFVASYL